MPATTKRIRRSDLLTGALLVGSCFAAISCVPNKDANDATNAVASTTEQAPTPSGLTVQRITRAPLPEDLDRLEPAIAQSMRDRAEQIDTQDNATAWKQLGMVYHGHERLALAGQCYEQTLLRDATDAETWYYLADVQYRRANLESAEASLRRVLPLSPYAPARWRLALWLLERGETEAAMEPALEARRLSPSDPSAALTLARVHLESEAPEEAARLLESVVIEPPANGYASFLLATAYRQLGRADEADAALRDANSSPSRVDPWLDRLSEGLKGMRADFASGAAALRSGEWERARQQFEALLEKHPDDSAVLNNLSLVYWELKDIDACLKTLEKLLASAPEDRNLHLRLATAYREKFRREKDEQRQSEWLRAALSHAERADAIQPGADAVALKASVVAATGRSDAAIAMYLEAAERERERPPGRARYLMKAASLYRSSGKIRESVRLMEEIHGLLPETFERTHTLAILKVQVGEFESARKLLQRALEMKPRDPRVLKTLRDLDQHEATGGAPPTPTAATDE